MRSVAGDSRWVVCMPGKRRQEFSDDAELVSLHFLVESPGNGARWRGVPLLSVAPDGVARRSFEKLMACVQGQGLTQEETLQIGGVELSLGATLAVRAAACEFLHRLLTLLQSDGLLFEPPGLEDTRVLASYRELSARDPGKELVIDALAANLGITVGQLNRLWQRELRTTPRRYWDQRRVRHACNLLQIQKLPVKVVAAELGYRHLSQFSNWFTQKVGSAPREYRQGRLS